MWGLVENPEDRFLTTRLILVGGGGGGGQDIGSDCDTSMSLFLAFYVGFTNLQT